MAALDISVLFLQYPVCCSSQYRYSAYTFFPGSPSEEIIKNMNAPSNSPPCENIDNCLNRDPESVENSDVAAEVESVLEGTTEDEQ